MMNIRIIVLSLIMMTVGTASYAQTVNKAKLDQYFDKLAEKSKAMGTIVIAKEGKVVYTRSIGYSEIGETQKKPLTTTSRYRIASVTKMYTAVLIFQLVEKGKLKLTDTLAKFFPQIANADKITIAQILAHRSGIHDALIDPNLRPKDKTLSITKDELVGIIAKGKSDFEPNTKHAYSNSGYALLGLIIEKLTGKTYAEILKANITSKLKLNDTYVATGIINVNKNESLTYKYNNGWKQEPETHPSILFGGGSIISTPVDMAKFIHALFESKLITKEHLAIMQTIKDEDGSGMEAFSFANKTFYGHTGGGDNYGAWLAYQPEEKLAVAYTTNAKLYPVADIMKTTMDIYYNRPVEIPTFEALLVSETILDKYVGVYSSTSAPVKFTVTRNGSSLNIQPSGQAIITLEATAQNKFKIEGNNAVAFEFDVEKSQLIIKRNGGERVFTKEK
ncbi:serine hydrolase domain-containing protein [Pedobacter boryungensis]|uniref:Beta-lactamase family protein n=1 Tax=Pedobacter boryungensis TaxID=869962 RepID=A0ABX2DAI0_9SPHI|nr:serine hydrolase domain-containing protein [Pedobacter boryungensis]NQX31049.1 beta-lactamase family protein [Pedobacter boryungensis]